MDLSLITAPVNLPVTVTELKDHLRIETTDEDAPLAMFLGAAIARFDGRHGVLRRALITQVWEMRLDAFPASGIIPCPLPPLQSVTHVKYLDSLGTEQTYSSANYAVNTRHLIGQIELGSSASWPSTNGDIGCVRVRFTAGYGADGTDVPDNVRIAILMHAAELYHNRGDEDGTPAARVINAIVAPYKIVEFENAGVLQ